MDRKQFDIHIGQSPRDSHVKLNGDDLSEFIQGVTVRCGNSSLTRLSFDVTPCRTAPIDLSAEFMVVPRCDRCAHWRRGSVSDAGRCQAIELPENSEIAELVTMGDFGCVKFLPKSTPAQAAK